MNLKITTKKIITITITTTIIILLIYLLYKNYKQNEGLIGYYGEPQIFNIGTRQWTPTHLMSYDVRGDIPIGTYPPPIFNEPEILGTKRYYRNPLEIPFYTPNYINPLLDITPSIYNTTFSVPYKNNNNDNNTQATPILDKHN